MFKPSVFFKGCTNHFGWPGKSFVRTHERWRQPAGVFHPTIRRIEWGDLDGGHPGDLPRPGAEGEPELSYYRTHLFVWARAAWRGLLAPQLRAIVSRVEPGRDGRECHPFTLGYVRGAVEQIVDFARPDDGLTIPGFIRIGALVDVWGLEWIDDLDGALSDLASGRLEERYTSEFDRGANLGASEMRSFLDGIDLEPRGLVAWFKREPEVHVEQVCASRYYRRDGSRDAR